MGFLLSQLTILHTDIQHTHPCLCKHTSTDRAVCQNIAILCFWEACMTWENEMEAVTKLVCQLLPGCLCGMQWPSLFSSVASSQQCLLHHPYINRSTNFRNFKMILFSIKDMQFPQEWLCLYHSRHTLSNTWNCVYMCTLDGGYTCILDDGWVLVPSFMIIMVTLV